MSVVVLQIQIFNEQMQPCSNAAVIKIPEASLEQVPGDTMLGVIKEVVNKLKNSEPQSKIVKATTNVDVNKLGKLKV